MHTDGTSISASWVAGKQFVAESASGHAFIMDTGEAVSGRNTVQLSAEKYCSVSAMLSASCTIPVEYRLEDTSSGEVKRGVLDVAH